MFGENVSNLMCSPMESKALSLSHGGGVSRFAPRPNCRRLRLSPHYYISSSIRRQTPTPELAVSPSCNRVALTRWSLAGGGGWSGFEGEDAKLIKLAEEKAVTSDDVIVLDVRLTGITCTCRVCAAHARSVLQSQPQVSIASVNLTAHTAVVWPVAEVKEAPNWKTELGETLVWHLKYSGFDSYLRVSSDEDYFPTKFGNKMEEVQQLLRENRMQHSMKAFHAPIIIVAFFLLERNLVLRAKIKVMSHMAGLLNILPSKARLLTNNYERGSNSTTEISCDSLSVGDQIVILPGDCVPVDGFVIAGESSINESIFGGEPLALTKLPGSRVAAGSTNLNGTLTVEVQRSTGDTAIADLVRSVEEAESTEPKTNCFIDQVELFIYASLAIIFWNVVLLLSAGICDEQYMFLNPFTMVGICSVLVLFTPCPCLALSTAFWVGTSLGATRGMFIRNKETLPLLIQSNSIVFDMTGVLTVGRHVVTKVVVAPSGQDSSHNIWSESEVLKLAAAVEANALHPFGNAIVEYARVINSLNEKKEATDGTFMEESGYGVVAVIDDKKVSVGTLEWVQRNGVTENPFLAVESLENQSIVFVGVDKDLVGLIYLEDKIREDAKLVVETLSKEGINVYMMSGEKKNVTEYVASVVGIPKDKVLSEVTPEEKKEFVSELEKGKKIVGVVVDRTNDAAALASANYGIAMGGRGGEASDVAQIVFMGNRLSQLLEALELSRVTNTAIRAHVKWSWWYHLWGALIFGILMPIIGMHPQMIPVPSIAAVVMGLNSLGVTLNMLLLRFRFFKKLKQIHGRSSSSSSAAPKGG